MADEAETPPIHLARGRADLVYHTCVKKGTRSPTLVWIIKRRGPQRPIQADMTSHKSARSDRDNGLQG